MTGSFPVGKVPIDVLAKLWEQHTPHDPAVVVGPGVGLDAAVIDVGEQYLVAKSDPITFASDRVGWYAVHINANDVACTGADPRWFLATLLLPEGQADEGLVQQIFGQIGDACETIGASLVGGHTEVTHGIERPIVMGCLLGVVDKGKLITTAGAKPGDDVALIGGVPIEAIAIIAAECSDHLEGKFDEPFLERCRNFLYQPGISVHKEAALAAKVEGVHAMHDPTEGGLAMGLWELAQASNTRIVVRVDDIPVLPEGERLCAALGLDPLASIASGALLLACDPEASAHLERSFMDSEKTFRVIGRVEDHDESHVLLQSEEATHELIPPERDEIAKLFE